MRSLVLLTLAFIAVWLILDEFYGKKKVISTLTLLMTGEMTPQAASDYSKALQGNPSVSDVFKSADSNAFDSRG